MGDNELLIYIKTIVTWETVFETKGNLFGSPVGGLEMSPVPPVGGLEMSPVPPVGGLEMSEEGSLEPVAGTCWGEEEADPEGD